jgi:Uma2 family endonuclease
MGFETTPLDQPPTPKRWTAGEYVSLAEAGLLGEGRTELIDGEILTMSPQSLPHVRAVNRVLRVLARGFGLDRLHSQGTTQLSDRDMPEPDLAVLARSLDDLEALPGPDDLLLVVEVSLSSLLADRTTKAGLYARSGIPEFWIVNLRDREVEVYREPSSDGYREVRRLTVGQGFRPLACPELDVRVDELVG